jgi:hypothetical protein
MLLAQYGGVHVGPKPQLFVIAMVRTGFTIALKVRARNVQFHGREALRLSVARACVIRS